MASSRLPGKALKEVVGFGPMLEVLINRAKKSGSVDRVIIATTTLESDDVLVEWANQKSYHTYRGSENNVLGRLIGACDQYKINDFVEILGDNPLVDPDVVCKCVSQYENENLNYLATTTKEYKNVDIVHCFPVGVRVQVIKKKLLLDIDSVVKEDHFREHATSYVYDKIGENNIKLMNNYLFNCDEEIANWNFAVNDLEGFNNMSFLISKCGIDGNLVDIVKTAKDAKIFL